MRTRTNGGLGRRQAAPLFGNASATPSRFSRLLWASDHSLCSIRYRFFTAVFLPVGAIHFAVFALVQLAVGLPMEKVIGTWRFTLLWLISGTGGYVVSAIFTPYQVRIPCRPQTIALSLAVAVTGCDTQRIHSLLVPPRPDPSPTLLSSQVESGPSPACYGLVAALLIELLQNWKVRRLEAPCAPWHSVGFGDGQVVKRRHGNSRARVWSGCPLGFRE